jgi:hypothetical protein
MFGELQQAVGQCFKKEQKKFAQRLLPLIFSSALSLFFVVFHCF